MAACESVPSPDCSADRPSKPPCHLRAIYLPIYGVLCILVATTTISVARVKRNIFAGSANSGQTPHGRFESCRGHHLTSADTADRVLLGDSAVSNSAVPNCHAGFRLEGSEVSPLKVQFRAENPNQRRGYSNGPRREGQQQDRRLRRQG